LQQTGVHSIGKSLECGKQRTENNIWRKRTSIAVSPSKKPGEKLDNAKNKYVRKGEQEENKNRNNFLKLPEKQFSFYISVKFQLRHSRRIHSGSSDRPTSNNIIGNFRSMFVEKESKKKQTNK
jgi:hypothetical protein